jgi:hypothetical protein
MSWSKQGFPFFSCGEGGSFSFQVMFGVQSFVLHLDGGQSTFHASFLFEGGDGGEGAVGNSIFQNRTFYFGEPP